MTEHPGRGEFENLVKESQDRIFNLALRLVGNHDDALDVTQETMIRAHSAFHTFRGDSHPFTWLYRIAVNESRRFTMRRSLRKIFSGDDSFLENIEESKPDPLSSWELKERAGIVRKTLGSLPHQYREAVVLRYIENLSYADVSKVLGCSEGTAKSKVSRGIKILEKKLDPFMKEGKREL